MPLLRGRHGGGDNGTKYRMREKMFSIGDDYWIETDGGERAFKVNGEALRIRKTFVLETAGGDELLTIREKKLSIRDKMEIERDGQTIATVRKGSSARCGSASRSTSMGARTWRRRATSSTTSTRSSAA